MSNVLLPLKLFWHLDPTCTENTDIVIYSQQNVLPSKIQLQCYWKQKTLLLSVPLTSLYIQAINGISDKDVQKNYTI